MNSSVLTFPKGGVHPPTSKQLTSHLAIEEMPLPAELEIVLGQHIGAPCEPVVEKRASVAEGDLIGEVVKGLGVPIHAPAAGKVKELTVSAHPMRVSSPSVTIKTAADVEPRQYTASDWTSLTSDELLQKIEKAGVIGVGGAGFPTHVKLSPPADANIDTLILNGAECEPYITADHRQMLESPDEVIEGARIMLRILGVSHCRVGIEDNKPDAIAAMTTAAAEQSSDGAEISVHALPVKYPQGSEKQLIQSLTGRKVPAFALPSQIGVVVQNVSTARAIYEAVALDKPYYEKVITISGGGIERPANLKVKIGTRISDIVEYLGGTTPDLRKVVLGGPMMGFAVSTLDIPILKTTSSVLLLSEHEIDHRPYTNCIRCGRCVNACPMGLQPNEIGIYVPAGKSEETEPFGALECFECGSCAYVCPAKRPLVQFIRLAKVAIHANR